jgi:uncharacterized membrane protein YwzB
MNLSVKTLRVIEFVLWVAFGFSLFLLRTLPVYTAFIVAILFITCQAILIKVRKKKEKQTQFPENYMGIVAIALLVAVAAIVLALLKIYNY